MAGKLPCGPYRCCQTYGKEHKGEDYVSRSDAFKIEISSTPEIILLEKISVRGIGNDDGSKGSDEGAEENTEGYQVLGAYLEGDEEADCSADESAYEAADRQADMVAAAAPRQAALPRPRLYTSPSWFLQRYCICTPPIGSAMPDISTYKRLDSMSFQTIEEVGA